MSLADAEAHQARHFGTTLTKDAPKAPEPVKVPKPRMNGTETQFSLILEAQKRKGEIADYRFEAVTFRLGHDCRYTPDFFIIVSTDPLKIRFAEIKGRHVWDDAKVKFRVAKEANPWAEWQMWQKFPEGWSLLI